MGDEFLPKPGTGRFRGETRLDAVAGFFVVLGIGVLVLVGSMTPHAIRIMTADGVHGTYTVGDPTLRCTRNHSCRVGGGTFRSDDGEVVRTGSEVGIGLRRPVQEGEEIWAYVVDDEIYTRNDMGSPVSLIVYGVPGLVVVAVGSAHFWRKRKRRNRRKT